MHQDAHHHHHHGAGADSWRLAGAAAITGLFMIVEIVGGIWSGSLTLLADAGHMFTDFAALFLAFLAQRIAARPADWKWTYGFDRVSILVAFVNGLALFVIAGFIVYEAIERFLAPPEIAGGLMLVVAAIGLVVNLVSFLMLHGGSRDSLNMRGALLHVLGDLLGSVAAIIAAIVIMATGWMPIDPLLSLLVAVIILKSAAMLVRDSGRILLEGAPDDLDRADLARHLVATLPGLDDVHHVHVWSISESRRMATFHASIDANADAEEVLEGIREEMRRNFGVDHVTVEIEMSGTPRKRACADCT